MEREEQQPRMRSKKTRLRPVQAVQAAVPAAPRSLWSARAETLGRSPLGFVIASVLVVLPCFWQSRIQAGDVSSHIYNAWFAQLIANGKATHLAIAFQGTNVLGDLMLSTLLAKVGATAAQRITVALAVLVFVWGAFAFVSTVSGRRAWDVLPVIAILAYGWTFHMGFLNFYLSLGLCLFSLAAAWTWKPKGLALAIPLFALAYVAHILAVAWAAVVLGYRWLALRTSHRSLPRLAAGGIAAIVALRFALGSFTQSRRVPEQWLCMTAADQAWIYDRKYWVILAGLLVLGSVWAFSLLRQRGIRDVLAGVPYHLCLFTALGVFALPTAIALPGYKHVLAYIAERMSLALGVCYCAAFANVKAPAFVRYFAPALMILFFGFLYRDDAILNRYEDRMTAAVATLKDQRVVTGIDEPSLRIDPFTHMIDRACLGVCYSYANYEPSTGQFRVRVLAPNPSVAFTYEDSWRLQTGSYIVKPEDLPLYRLELEVDGTMAVRALAPGTPNGMANRDLLSGQP